MTRCLRGPAAGLALLVVVHGSAAAQNVAGSRDNVVLVTLDGARVQEIFGGLDADILRSTLKEGQSLEEQPVYRRFWAATPEARRAKLMPFFWGTLMVERGSIAGNRARQSQAQVTNTHRFSYPGYAEILVGEPHDADIKSNDPIRNPYRTVLEELRERLGVERERVATFASWANFTAIAEHTEGATYVNAGPARWARPGAAPADWDALQLEALPPWDAVRFDAFTFRAAMAHLAAARPRVLYLSFDETDDWAHDGRYDRLLEAYARTDGYVQTLWNWLQSQPQYRGRTHLLITTDHGRGRTTADWRDHGAKIAGAEEVWMAFVSPTMSRRGEWHDHAPVYTNQIAATIASWLGVDWTAGRSGVGKPIDGIR